MHCCSHPLRSIRSIRSIRSFRIASPFLHRRHIVRSLDDDRQSLKSLFYQSSYPLNGQELKTILKSRQVRIAHRGSNVMMQVLPATWDVPDELWNNLAILLNEWNATSIVRDKMPIHMEIAGPEESVSVALNVIIKKNGEWYDHA